MFKFFNLSKGLWLRRQPTSLFAAKYSILLTFQLSSVYKTLHHISEPHQLKFKTSPACC